MTNDTMPGSRKASLRRSDVNARVASEETFVDREMKQRVRDAYFRELQAAIRKGPESVRELPYSFLAAN
jgi:hypothetical protein